MISHKHQCVFVHIPKTGGTSLGKLLLGDLDAYEGKTHSPFSGPYLKFPQYFKFSFVRNPWDRIVSYYHEKKCLNNVSFSDYIKMVRGDFPEKRRELSRRDPNVWKHARGYLNFWLPQKSIKHLDYIGKLESIQSDWETISKRLNINHPLIHARKTLDRSPYQDYYDGESKEIVRKLYEEDVQYFGYSYE
jgi:chondroitin 4-sulfotransferase 11